MQRGEDEEFNNELAREERRTTRSQQRIDAQRGRQSSRGRGAGARSKSVGFSHAEFRDSPLSYKTSLNESGTSTIQRTLTPNIHANPSARKNLPTSFSNSQLAEQRQATQSLSDLVDSRFENQTKQNETNDRVDGNVSQPPNFLNLSEPNIVINLSSDSSNSSVTFTNQGSESVASLITTSTQNIELNPVQPQSPNQTVNNSNILQPNQNFSQNPSPSDNLSQAPNLSQNERVDQAASAPPGQSPTSSFGQTANTSKNQTTPTTTNTPNSSPNITLQASNNNSPVTPTFTAPSQPSVLSPKTPTNTNRNIQLSPTTRLLLQRAAQQAPTAGIRNTSTTPATSPVSSRTFPFFTDNEKRYNTPIPLINRLLNLNPHSCLATPQFATPTANQFQPISRIIQNSPMSATETVTVSQANASTSATTTDSSGIRVSSAPAPTMNQASGSQTANAQPVNSLTLQYILATIKQQNDQFRADMMQEIQQVRQEVRNVGATGSRNFVNAGDVRTNSSNLINVNHPPAQQIPQSTESQAPNRSGGTNDDRRRNEGCSNHEQRDEDRRNEDRRDDGRYERRPSDHARYVNRQPRYPDYDSDDNGWNNDDDDDDFYNRRNNRPLQRQNSGYDLRGSRDYLRHDPHRDFIPQYRREILRDNLREIKRIPSHKASDIAAFVTAAETVISETLNETEEKYVTAQLKVKTSEVKYISQTNRQNVVYWNELKHLLEKEYKSANNENALHAKLRALTQQHTETAADFGERCREILYEHERYYGDQMNDVLKARINRDITEQYIRNLKNIKVRDACKYRGTALLLDDMINYATEQDVLHREDDYDPELKCTYCGLLGHKSAKCGHKERAIRQSNEAANYQKDRTCQNCGQIGHTKIHCFVRPIKPGTSTNNTSGNNNQRSNNNIRQTNGRSNYLGRNFDPNYNSRNNDNGNSNNGNNQNNNRQSQNNNRQDNGNYRRNNQNYNNENRSNRNNQNNNNANNGNSSNNYSRNSNYRNNNHNSNNSNNNGNGNRRYNENNRGNNNGNNSNNGSNEQPNRNAQVNAVNQQREESSDNHSQSEN